MGIPTRPALQLEVNTTLEAVFAVERKIVFYKGYEQRCRRSFAQGYVYARKRLVPCVVKLLNIPEDKALQLPPKDTDELQYNF